MRLSVVFVTQEGSPDPRPALEALVGCLRPGDEVIALDAGSNDGTAERLEETLAGLDFGSGVAVSPLLLGIVPADRRAIAFNVGIRAATGEAYLLLAGERKPDAASISAARAAMEARGADLLVALPEGPEGRGASAAASGLSRPPGFGPGRLGPTLLNMFRPEPRSSRPETLPPPSNRIGNGESQKAQQEGRAHRMPSRGDAPPFAPIPLRAEEVLHHAMMHPPLPEGMIFRRGLLSRSAAFEENSPLSVSLLRWGLFCRAKRPMGWPAALCSDGREEEAHAPAAVPDHYTALLARAWGGGAERALLLSWLCGHMIRDIPRLPAAERLAHATDSSRAFAAVPGRIWRRAMRAMAHPSVQPLAEALRRGEAVACASLWTQEADERLLQEMVVRMETAETRVEMISSTQARMSWRVESLCRIAEFAALEETEKDKEEGGAPQPDVGTTAPPPRSCDLVPSSPPDPAHVPAAKNPPGGRSPGTPRTASDDIPGNPPNASGAA